MLVDCFLPRRCASTRPFHLLFACLIFVPALLLVRPVQAATFVVTTTTDNPADPSSLRAAINSAQASTDASDTITILATGTISLLNGELALSNPNNVVGKTVTITGPGVQNLTITGNRNTGTNTTRVFHFSGVTVSVGGLTITQGAAGDGKSGGGVLVEGAGASVGLTNCSVTVSGPSGLANIGGALALTNCVVSNNLANNGGGGITSSGGSLTLSGCTVDNNGVDPGEGGGIASANEILILTNCAVTANQSFVNGGGIASSGDTLTMTNCNVSDNVTDGGRGGGLYLQGSGNNSADIRSCTFSLNATGNIFLENTDDVGGGVDNEGDSVTMTNCTVSGNGTNGQSPGGGLYNIHGALTLRDCTVTENNPGNLDNEAGGTATVAATIIAITPAGLPNIVNNGSITSAGSNLIGDPDGNGFTNDPSHADPNSTGNHDQTGVTNPSLGPLQDNGGPTPTEALQTGSPAIDADFADSTTTDQRGAPRPFGARNDVGAFEFGATAAPVTPNTALVTNTNDSGAGSLRNAVNTINANPGGTVVFDPSVFGPGMPQTITLTSGALVISQNMTITGPGAGLLAVSGNHAGAVVDLTGSVTADIHGITVKDGSVGPHFIGGGIFTRFGTTLTLTDSVVTGCVADFGGGLGIAGTATLTNCIISGNTASTDGGGLYVEFGSPQFTMTNCTVAGNSAGNSGGGIANSSGSLAFLINCTLSGNAAAIGGGASNDVVLYLLNCTVSGNTATQGGGLFNDGALVVTESTISANAAPTGSGVDSQTTNATSVTGSILAGNTGSANIASSVPFISDGSNVIGDPDGNGFTNDPSHADPNSTGNHDQTGVTNPGLGPLQDNGGPTQTMALLPGSPAIDANFAGDGGMDQRGVSRPQGTRNDIGAYEFGVPVAQNDAYSGVENSTLSIPSPGVLANDTGDGSTLTAVIVSQPTHGSLTLNSDGSFTFMPNTDFVGMDSFTYRAENAQEQSSNTATVTLMVVNALPPTTTANVTGPAGNNGFYKGSVTVTLAATDHSGAEPITTFYTVNGGAQQTYAAPIILSADGIYNLTFFSQDAARRIESPQSLTVKIDATPPTLTFGTPAPAPNAAGFANTLVSVSYTASDATSGIASSAPGSPLTFTAEGANQTQTVTVTDNAGNSAQFTSPAVSIDLTKPVTTAATQSVAAGTQVTLSASDNLSGVASTAYAVDGGAAQTYTTPFIVQGNGAHAVTFHSTDKAGNLETPQTSRFTVNIAAPVTTASLSGPLGKNGYYIGAVTVTLTAQSSASTVVETFYTVDGGAVQTYTTPFTVSGDGMHIITFYSTDSAGNTEAQNQQAVKIDSTPPVTAASLSGPQAAAAARAARHSQVTANSNTTYTGPVTVTLSPKDNLSGVAVTTFSLDNGQLQTYTQPFLVSSLGTHTLSFSSTDNAGNVETAHSITFTVVSATTPILHTFPAGLTLFAVPKDMSGLSLSQVFDQPSIKLAVWMPQMLQYVLSPTPPADTLRPGQGYWARFRQTTNLFDMGTPTPTGAPYAIAIHVGWNMIGDPFPSSAPPSQERLQTSTGTFALGDSVAKVLLSPTFYSYDTGSGQYQAHALLTDALMPFVGYWLYSRCDAALIVNAP